jgi:hypothetical protein
MTELQCINQAAFPPETEKWQGGFSSWLIRQCEGERLGRAPSED